MQVIAHRMNTLTLARQALALGCDWVEIDVWDGRVRREAEGAGQYLEEFAALAIGLYVDVKRGGRDSLTCLDGRERTVVWAPDVAPFVGLPLMPQAKSSDELREALSRWAPRFVAFDARDFTPELVDIAKAAGAQVFVDRLGAFDNPWKWEEAQAMGADGIQTDRPRELLQWLGR